MERAGLDLNGPRATVRRPLGSVDRQWQGVHRKVHEAEPADVLFERTAWRTASRPGRPSPDRLRPPAEIERFDESLRRELPDMVGGVRRPGRRAGRDRRMGARLQPQSATPVAEDCHVGVGVPALHGGRSNYMMTSSPAGRSLKHCPHPSRRTNAPGWPVPALLVQPLRPHQPSRHERSGGLGASGERS